MRFKNTQVYNFEGAFRGMRNPLGSWDKSDSIFEWVPEEWLDDVFADLVYSETEKDNIEWNGRIKDLDEEYTDKIWEKCIRNCGGGGTYQICYIGANDLDLAQRLIKSGPEHRKFMRQIIVSVNITAPLYWQNSFCQ